MNFIFSNRHIYGIDQVIYSFQFPLVNSLDSLPAECRFENLAHRGQRHFLNNGNLFWNGCAFADFFFEVIKYLIGCQFGTFLKLNVSNRHFTGVGVRALAHFAECVVARCKGSRPMLKALLENA